MKPDNTQKTNTGRWTRSTVGEKLFSEKKYCFRTFYAVPILTTSITEHTKKTACVGNNGVCRMNEIMRR